MASSEKIKIIADFLALSKDSGNIIPVEIFIIEAPSVGFWLLEAKPHGTKAGLMD